MGPSPWSADPVSYAPHTGGGHRRDDSRDPHSARAGPPAPALRPPWGGARPARHPARARAHRSGPAPRRRRRGPSPGEGVSPRSRYLRDSLRHDVNRNVYSCMFARCDLLLLDHLSERLPLRMGLPDVHPREAREGSRSAGPGPVRATATARGAGMDGAEKGREGEGAGP